MLWFLGFQYNLQCLTLNYVSIVYWHNMWSFNQKNDLCFWNFTTYRTWEKCRCETNNPRHADFCIPPHSLHTYPSTHFLTCAFLLLFYYKILPPASCVFILTNSAFSTVVINTENWEDESFQKYLFGQMFSSLTPCGLMVEPLSINSGKIVRTNWF